MEIQCDGFKMRLVEESDAAFIVSLRTDAHLSKYLSNTSADIAAQRQWIRGYKEREQKGTEYYFVAEDSSGAQLGLTRLYNFNGTRFELGSWIFKKGIPEAVPVLADIAARDFAFEKLGFAICTFEVNKKNVAVVRYHQLYKPVVVKEDEKNYYFELPVEVYQQQKKKILKLFGYGS